MAVAVVVPWRPGGCPHREAAWRWLRQHWASTYPGWEVIEGGCPDGPWIKALAVRDALAHTDADVIVLADADVWTEGVAAAVDVVAARGGWAIPHWKVRRLDEASTGELLAGAWFGPGASLARRPYIGYPGGGISVLERELLDQAPLDPRFVGWGQEDQAAAAAWTTLGGKPWRGRDDLWHLWHPPQPGPRPWGSPASAELWDRYRAAIGDAVQMTGLIAELADQA